MADETILVRSGIQSIRLESGKFVPAEGLGALVENFYQTREGTLRTVWGPTPWLPNYSANPMDAPDNPDIKGLPVAFPGETRYGRIHGIHHAMVGKRDILLAHVGESIWEYVGWRHQWVALIGPAPLSPMYTTTFALDASTREAAEWPTQFVTTPTGIVIVPKRSRAYFYDGASVMPLGYSQAPGAPHPHGPATTGVNPDLQNEGRYAHDARFGESSAMHTVFRFCRIGTTSSASGFETSFLAGAASSALAADHAAGIAGWLEPGEWRCKRQWIDMHSNLSPLSPPSDEIKVHRQISSISGGANVASVDLVRKQFAWSALEAGREGTIGQTLFRTRDLKNSGDAGYYEVTQDATGNNQAFATIPDNMTTLYPDNIPDVWLGAAPLEPIAVPLFRLCRLVFSRLFIAHGGALRWSMIGRWGTFLKNAVLYPDPSGAEITGMLQISGGFLVFTDRSTFLIMPNDTGGGFRASTINSSVGCAAPNSCQVLPNGQPIWLAQEGFYTFIDGETSPISEEIYRTVRRFTPGRVKAAVSAVDSVTQEYRCWVSLDGDTENTHCFCYRGDGWRQRTDVQATAVCVTENHPAYMIAGGEVPKLASTGTYRGVWLVDHEVDYFQTDIALREAILETSWLNVKGSDIRRTVYKVIFWFVETSNATLSVEVLRDWRNDVVETPTVERHATDDVPAFFNTVAYNSTATNAKWRRRRPFFTKAEIYIPSSEVVKFRIRGTGFWEFIGIKWMDTPRPAGGHRIPR